MQEYEIEIKAYCDDQMSVIRSLEGMGAEKIGSHTETDVYFNHPSRDFKVTDEALRIRRMCGKNILTYKGAKIGTASKTRIEEEAEVSDFDVMKRILFHLGFIETGMVLKERMVYRAHGIEICIDKVNGLGCFVELEKKGVDIKSVEEELFILAERLNLSKFERRSYLELLLCSG